MRNMPAQKWGSLLSIFLFFIFLIFFRRVLHDHEHEWDELMEVWPQQWLGYTVARWVLTKSRPVFAPS